MADWHSNIDLVFRNGLKDHEVLPPEDVWENVSRSLPERRSRIYPALMRAAAFATLVLSTVTAVYFLHNKLTDTLANAPALTLNQDAMPEGQFLASEHNSGIAAQLQKQAAKMPVVIAMEETSQKEENNTDISGIPSSMISENNTFKPSNNEFNLADIRYLDVSGKVKSKTFDITYIPEERGSSEGEKWKIGASVLPSYHSRFSFGNDDAAADYLKSEKMAFSYSGGLSFTFEASRRLSFVSGIFYSSIGQRIDGITSFTGFSKYNESKSASDFSILTSSGTINSTNKDIYFVDNSNIARVQTRYSADIFDPMKANLSHLSNSLIQSMSYLEIPLMMKYKIIDRKVDINMLGGLSYGILIGNTSYINSGGSKYTIGHTEGLSPVTFSSSVGMGMEYKLTTNISFNLEPVLRYYITPLGGITGSMVHPYSFGILSGIFYNF